ncbi:MAG: type I methionyl aminopeptidase [Bacilli bacterium]
MITLRNEDELAKLRQAGRIVALTHQYLKQHLVPGITTKKLDDLAEKFILSQGATPSFKGLYGFPGSVCISLNETLVHGIPSKKIVLKEGDIITIDIGACWQGYHGDSAWTYAVGEISEEAQKLLDVTEQALFEGLKMARAGNRIGDISHAIQKYVEKFGFSLPREYTGHGVGREIHEDPIVPNYGKPHRGPLLRKGMVIAVEPMVNAGVKETITLSDGWTVVTSDGRLCAHYEHTVAITDGACEIFTTL